MVALSAAFVVAACSDAAGPSAVPAPGAPFFSNGHKLGQCFLQVGLDGVQVEPGPDGNAVVSAPAGEVVTRVAVKAGTVCWFTPPEVSGTYTITVNGAACYVVAGLGTDVATVTRVGSGPTCKDISHVELIDGVAPPTTGFVQLCVVVTGDNPPPAALTTPFPFAVAGQEIGVAHGTCADPIEVGPGALVIAEHPNSFGIGLWNAETVPDGRVIAVDVPGQTVTVMIVAGSVTIVTITNLWVPDPGGDH
jgi:hypothetical protein